MRALALAIGLLLAVPLAAAALPGFTTFACGGDAPGVSACTTGSHVGVWGFPRVIAGEGFVGTLWSQVDDATGSFGTICSFGEGGRTCIDWGSTRIRGHDQALATHTCGSQPPPNTGGLRPGIGAWTCELDALA